MKSIFFRKGHVDFGTSASVWHMYGGREKHFWTNVHWLSNNVKASKTWCQNHSLTRFWECHNQNSELYNWHPLRGRKRKTSNLKYPETSGREETQNPENESDFAASIIKKRKIGVSDIWTRVFYFPLRICLTDFLILPILSCGRICCLKIWECSYFLKSTRSTGIMNSCPKLLLKTGGRK